MANRYVLPLLVFLSPLFFATLTPNFFATPKQLLVVLAVVVLGSAWAFAVFRNQALTFFRSPLLLPLSLFTLALVTNLIIHSEGRIDALIGRGSLYLLGLVLAYFAGLSGRDHRTHRYVLYAVIGSASLLALHGLLQLTFLVSLPGLPSFMASRSFTPTGNPLVTLTWLFLGIVTTFLYSLRSQKGKEQYFGFVLGILQTVAAVAYLSLMLPGSELAPLLLPYQATWSVTLDALKTPRTFFFGVGLANFPIHFTAVKPLSLNLGAFWNLTPLSATSEFLQLLATTGVLGFVTFLLLPLTLLTRLSRSFRTQESHFLELFSLFMLSLLALFFTPASVPVLTLFFITLGLLSTHTSSAHPLTRQLGVAIPLLSFLIIIGLTIYTARAYLAEIYLLRANRALAASDGKTVYDSHVQILKLVPQLASYRLSYSQVNLSLASAMSQKADLTDPEREQIAALISQAIREAKIAANLRPHEARVWQNLGSIYRNLINVAEGAEQFALTAYAQALSLDPGNPSLRVEYGGLLYQLSGREKESTVKNDLLSRSIQEFQLAVQLKPDYANGYFNLSKALESAGNLPAAYAAMQKTVASLDPNSTDLPNATSELSALQAKLPASSPLPSASPTPSENSELSAPSPLPSPLPGGEIEIPEESSAPSPES